MKISLVIAIQDDGKFFLNLLDKLCDQKRLPDELIIVDSSVNYKFSDDVKKKLINLKIFNKYKKITKCYQGKGLNEGIKISDGDLVCFLDSKTTPNNDWLKDYENLITKRSLDLVWGNTTFRGTNYFQNLYKAATYGNINHKSVPGTMILKKKFSDDNFFFNENLRSSFDLEWKEKINFFLKSFHPKKNYITYDHLPKNIIELVKRHSIYSYYTAIGNSQNNLKDFYLSLFLIFSALIIPRWNYLFDNWDRNPLFIPNITKIYLLCIILIGLMYFILKKINILKNLSFFELCIKVAIFIFFSIGVYRWNVSIANWLEQSTLYIPHITKIYIFLITGAIILYRGALRPIKRQERIKFLFPTNWLLIGIIGFFIDIIKMPFYIFGSIFSNLKILFQKIL